MVAIPSHNRDDARADATPVGGAWGWIVTFLSVLSKPRVVAGRFANPDRARRSFPAAWDRRFRSVTGASARFICFLACTLVLTGAGPAPILDLTAAVVEQVSYDVWGQPRHHPRSFKQWRDAYVSRLWNRIIRVRSMNVELWSYTEDPIAIDPLDVVETIARATITHSKLTLCRVTILFEPEIFEVTSEEDIIRLRHMLYSERYPVCVLSPSSFLKSLFESGFESQDQAMEDETTFAGMTEEEMSWFQEVAASQDALAAIGHDAGWILKFVE